MKHLIATNREKSCQALTGGWKGARGAEARPREEGTRVPGSGTEPSGAADRRGGGCGPAGGAVGEGPRQGQCGAVETLSVLVVGAVAGLLAPRGMGRFGPVLGRSCPSLRFLLTEE